LYSGVDATIADDSAYLSHIFGLRAVPEDASHNPHTSDGHPTTTLPHQGRNYPHSKLRQQVPAPVEGADRPVIVRDPYQTIGIRKGIEGHGGESKKMQELTRIRVQVRTKPYSRNETDP